MFLDHCVSLLNTGHSGFKQSALSDTEQITFALESGVRARKIDSLKTALLMLEMIKVTSPKSEDAARLARFEHFIEYLFDNFREATAMAMVKYAIHDRRIQLAKLNDAKCMKKVTAIFKPSLLDGSKKPEDVSKFKQFTRMYDRLKKLAPMSQLLNDYVGNNVEHMNELFAGRVAV